MLHGPPTYQKASCQHAPATVRPARLHITTIMHLSLNTFCPWCFLTARSFPSGTTQPCALGALTKRTWINLYSFEHRYQKLSWNRLKQKRECIDSFNWISLGITLTSAMTIFFCNTFILRQALPKRRWGWPPNSAREQRPSVRFPWLRLTHMPMKTNGQDFD